MVTPGLIITPPMHGIGGRVDLPVPSWLAVYAGAIVVAVSFIIAIVFWTKPRFASATVGHPLPDQLSGWLSSSGVRVILRASGLAVLTIFLIAAWGGPNDGGVANPAPTWFYVWFWVGLVPASTAFGRFWSLMNPLRSVSAVIRRITPLRSVRLPSWVGYWPAVVGLLAFVWLELVFDESAQPRTVALFVTVYAAVHVVAGVVFGDDWFDRGDAFEVYALMVSYASPWGRDTAGRIILRNPLRGLAAAPTFPDLTPVVLTILGSTAFDGLSRTTWWSNRVAGTDRAEYLWLGTEGLLGALVVVGATYGLAVWWTGRFMPDGFQARARFAHTIVPIAIGYTVAHYFSFALFQGQEGYLLANDPLVRGWNLFGLQNANVNYFLMSAGAIAFVQVGAIVVGHVIAVLSAHDEAIGSLPKRVSRLGQYPMIAVMILYTSIGILLVSRG